MTEQGEVDELGFDTNLFPFDFRGHNILIVENKCYVNIKERLTFHLALHCPVCGEESIVRGKLRHKYQQHQNNAALMKIAALGEYRQSCPRTTKRFIKQDL